jgi:hypothetical protein
MPNGELRCTIVIADDLDTEEVEIRALGDQFLPAPIRKPAREFDAAWAEFGAKLNEFRKDDGKNRGPWGG